MRYASGALAGLRTTAAVAAAMFVLAGCSGADSGSDASAGTPEDSGTSQADKDTEETPQCVGDGKGSITLTADGEEKLPGGGTAAFGSADLEAKPPTVTFELGESTNIERKHASDLAVGDEFGVQMGVYVVVSICADEATIDEF